VSKKPDIGGGMEIRRGKSTKFDGAVV